MRRGWLLALLALASVAVVGPAAAASRGRFQPAAHPAVPLGAVTLRVLRLPVGWIAGWIGRPTAGEATRGAASLSRDSGWTPLGFPLRDSGLGLLVQLRGRAELGAVEIVFEDGDLRRIDLARTRTYGDGLYELATFESERRVMVVRLAARARSREASLKVLLLREAPAGS